MSEIESKGEYILGQSDNDTRMFKQRTVQSDISFMVEHIKPDMRILDIGCGPASITVDLAKNYVPRGSVTGIEPKEESLEAARKLASDDGVANIAFKVGNAMKLPFEDESFDLVHTHQVLMYVYDPIQALKEMQRVTKHGGVIAIRESDHDCHMLYPQEPIIYEWLKTYAKIAADAGGDCCIGKRLKSLIRQSGFKMENAVLTTSNLCYTSPQETKYVAQFMADRTNKAELTQVAIAKGVATQEKLDEFAQAWVEWGNHEDAVLSLSCMEVLY